MKKRRLLSLPVVVLLAVCCFCGCTPCAYLTVECKDMSEHQQIFILVQPLEDDELCDTDDADLKNSEIYSYDEDGWIVTERLSGFHTLHSQTGVDLEFSSSDKLRDFCEKHKKIKVASCNDKWQAVTVSDEFDVLCKDKFAVVQKISMDKWSGGLQREELLKRKFMGSLDQLTLGLMMTLLSWVFDFILMIELCIFLSKKHRPRRSTALISFGLMSIFNVVLLAVCLFEYVVPYFNVDDSRFGASEAQMLIFLEFPWLVCWGLLVLLLYKLANEDENTQAVVPYDPYGR